MGIKCWSSISSQISVCLCVYVRPTNLNMDSKHDGLENSVTLRYRYPYLLYEVEGPQKKKTSKSLVPGETNIIIPLKIEAGPC